MTDKDRNIKEEVKGAARTLLGQIKDSDTMKKHVKKYEDNKGETKSETAKNLAKTYYEDAKESIVEKKEEMTPASLEDRTVDGLDTLIGEYIKTPIGKTRAYECYELVESILETDDIVDSDDFRNVIATKAAGEAWTTPRELINHYLKHELMEWPNETDALLATFSEDAKEEFIDGNPDEGGLGFVTKEVARYSLKSLLKVVGIPSKWAAIPFVAYDIYHYAKGVRSLIDNHYPACTRKQKKWAKAFEYGTATLKKLDAEMSKGEDSIILESGNKKRNLLYYLEEVRDNIKDTKYSGRKELANKVEDVVEASEHFLYEPKMRYNSTIELPSDVAKQVYDGLEAAMDETKSVLDIYEKNFEEFGIVIPEKPIDYVDGVASSVEGVTVAKRVFNTIRDVFRR